MKTRLAVLGGIAFALAVVPAQAEKPLKDYSFIRGVNYGMNGDQAVLERDLALLSGLVSHETGREWKTPSLVRP